MKRKTDRTSECRDPDSCAPQMLALIEKNAGMRFDAHIRSAAIERLLQAELEIMKAAEISLRVAVSKAEAEAVICTAMKR